MQKFVLIIPLLFLITWTAVWWPKQIVLTFAGLRALCEQSHSIYASPTSFVFYIQNEVPVTEPCWSSGSFIFTDVDFSVSCPWTLECFQCFAIATRLLWTFLCMTPGTYEPRFLWGIHPGVEVPAYMVQASSTLWHNAQYFPKCHTIPLYTPNWSA